jgi:transposase
MLGIHANAGTTPAVRAELARSSEPTGVLAARYGISTETVRKWRRRGPEDCADHSSRPQRLPWKSTDAERAIVCAVREATRFPLDDLTFAPRHFLPHFTRDSVYRMLRAEGDCTASPTCRRSTPTSAPAAARGTSARTT